MLSEKTFSQSRGKNMGISNITETEETTHQQEVTKKKGGLRTLPFIIANETFEKVASFGLLANMMTYLLDQYNFKITTGVSILFLWAALSNFTPIVGAFLSDSFFGRFRVILIGTLISLTGMIVLLLTAILPYARPPYCPKTPRPNCATPNLNQRLLLYFSFFLMSIGAGGIRPCSMAFGADQVNRPENPNNERVLRIFFNWYYASVGISLMVAVTVIVYIQDKAGWVPGFGVPVGLMLFSTVMFFLGSSLYVKVKGNKNLFSGIAHVVAASWKNRHLSMPPNNYDGWYYHKGSKLVAPTDKLRFLNKACIIKSPSKDITPEGLATDPWSLCTVRQVEELKALIKVLPIWSAGIIIAATIGQHSISLTQARAMNKHLTPHFEIQPGSFAVFSLLTLTLWVAIYDRAIVPLMSRHFTNRPNGLSFKERMGIGLVISCLATSVAAIVEQKRREKAVMHGEIMSAMWLIPQYSLGGLAEAFNAIGQIEFYYSQLPKSLASIAVALLTLGMGFGNLVGALIVKIVDDSSTKGGRLNWLDDDLNKGRYDYYYWLLTLVGFFNFLYYCLCSWGYGSCEERSIWDEEVNGVEKDKETIDDQDLPKSKESSTVFAT